MKFEIHVGMAAWEAGSVMSNLFNISAFALASRKAVENLAAWPSGSTIHTKIQILRRT